jgi:hypothetical protein
MRGAGRALPGASGESRVLCPPHSPHLMAYQRATYLLQCVHLFGRFERSAPAQEGDLCKSSPSLFRLTQFTC